MNESYSRQRAGSLRAPVSATIGLWNRDGLRALRTTVTIRQARRQPSRGGGVVATESPFSLLCRFRCLLEFALSFLVLTFAFVSGWPLSCHRASVMGQSVAASSRRSATRKALRIGGRLRSLDLVCQFSRTAPFLRLFPCHTGICSRRSRSSGNVVSARSLNSWSAAIASNSVLRLGQPSEIRLP